MGVQKDLRRDAAGNIAIAKPAGTISKPLHIGSEFQVGGETLGTDAVALRASGGVLEVDEGSGYGPLVGGLDPQQPDTTHSPVALYLFNGDMLDSSGNSRDVKVESGDESYSNGVVPGTLGFKFNGSTVLTLVDPLDEAAFKVLGDITVMFAFNPSDTSSNGSIAGVNGQTSNEVDNKPWFIHRSGRKTIWSSQNGSGIISSRIPAKVSTTIGDFQIITFRRESDVISTFLNGILLDTSPTLTTPTGGSNAEFQIGGDWGLVLLVSGVLGFLKIVSTALTDAQILTEAKRVIGIE